MHFSEDDLKKIKAFHVTTKLSIQILDSNLKKLKAYFSGIHMVIPYKFPKWRRKEFPIQFDYGFLKEIFLSILYKEKRIIIGPWLTNPVTDQDIVRLMCVINKIKTSDLTQNEFRNYFDLLPIYSLGDIRDILILLGFLFDMDLEGLYSKMLHENVTQNQLQIQNNSYRINSNNVIFEAERYSFNYESRILNLVAKGDLNLLKKVSLILEEVSDSKQILSLYVQKKIIPL